MRYIGKLENGKQFDANTAGAPFKFTLGRGEVIRGWDEGLVGMAVGGERRLTVSATARAQPEPSFFPSTPLAPPLASPLPGTRPPFQTNSVLLMLTPDPRSSGLWQPKDPRDSEGVSQPPPSQLVVADPRSTLKFDVKLVSIN